MHIPELIRKKRDGESLTREEIEFLVRGYTSGAIPDYQFSALLMAIYIRGMKDEELLNLTRSYIESGLTLDLGEIDKPKVDKHSTGGVGDKVSIPLAPLVASLDVVVPMISGRGLGHTGGTLDKLESIPGFRTNLTVSEFKAQLKTIGVAITGQTGELAPADGKIYALRDVTATVDSIPLIAASIMSKKLAEGIDGLVLDVKTGSGAFMAKLDDALSLAKTMTKLGTLYGKKTIALITDMSEPLGKTVGNALEIVESIDILRNEKPDPKLLELILMLGAYMLIIAGVENEIEKGVKRLQKAISSGKAYEKFLRMVESQGGDLNSLEKHFSLVRTKLTLEVTSSAEGYVAEIDTRRIGLAACNLGAGRIKKEDKIDHSVGFIIFKKIGDSVEKYEPLARVFANDEEKAHWAAAALKSAFKISETKPSKPPLIYGIVDETGIRKLY
ncbi:MAG: thymidine phosphorylase [bacterium]